MIDTEIQTAIDYAIKWHRHDGVLTQLVNLFNLFGYRQRWTYILNENAIAFAVNIGTNGTTPVNPFDGKAQVAIPFRITSIYLISLDTTAATITVKNGSSTVATIAKGTVAGVMTGATSLANTDFVPGNSCTVVSSSAGNAMVIINFIFPTN